MKKSMSVLAVACATALAQPAAAVTFPSLTTIYIGSGVLDSGGGPDVGIATSIHCSNVSGVSARVRVLILGANGTFEGALAITMSHGNTVTFSTHSTNVFADGGSLINTGFVSQGVVNVESTNSAVFCTAAVIDAQSAIPVFSMPLHLVRLRPHPGSVE